MQIKNIQEAEKILQPFLEVAAQTLGKNITLARTERLMSHLGNPERKLCVVHVAGTSGKTSTTYYIATMLQNTKHKVGSTVSPHVDSITERVQIDGLPLEETKFCDYLGEFLELIKFAPEVPTWFEVLIAFALWVFAEKEHVQYAVIETGLGGLQDSTNICAQADKLCVITDIGYDHMQILGSRLGSIAHQKAGIIHEGNTAIMYEQDSEIMQVVRFWVSQQDGAELLTFDQKMLAQAYGQQFIAGMPEYQKRNWLLAFAAYKWLAKRDGFNELSATALQKTQMLQVPGRMDLRVINEKTIIMDGAHNEQKMQEFVQSFQTKYPNMRVPILLALKQGKEVEALVPLLKSIACEVIITSFTKAQDVPVLSILPEDLVHVFQEGGIEKVRAVSTQHEAYVIFLSHVQSVGIITGSFFLISQLREKEHLI